MRPIHFSWQISAISALSLIVALCLTAGAAPQPTSRVNTEIPSELVKPELPLWEKWSESFLEWLRSATLDGTSAQSEKTH
jgi:hypothetical protein